MSSFNGFPHTILHESTARHVPIEEAQERIQRYLKLSKRRPHLHPDALLEQSGPTFSTTGGSQGGIILHQLRRFEAGLRGEVLGPEKRIVTLNGEVFTNGDVLPGQPSSSDAKLDAMIAAAEAEMAAEDGLSSPTAGNKKRKADDMESDSATERVEIANGVMKASGDKGGWQDPAIMELQDDGREAGGFEDHENTLVGEGGQVPNLDIVEAAEPLREKQSKRRKHNEPKDTNLSTLHTKLVNGTRNSDHPTNHDASVAEAKTPSLDKKAERQARKQAKKERKAMKKQMKEASNPEPAKQPAMTDGIASTQNGTESKRKRHDSEQKEDFNVHDTEQPQTKKKRQRKEKRPRDSAENGSKTAHLGERPKTGSLKEQEQTDETLVDDKHKHKHKQQSEKKKRKHRGEG